MSVEGSTVLVTLVKVLSDHWTQWHEDRITYLAILVEALGMSKTELPFAIERKQ